MKIKYFKINKIENILIYKIYFKIFKILKYFKIKKIENRKYEEGRKVVAAGR